MIAKYLKLGEFWYLSELKMIDYSAAVVGIPTLEQPLNGALEHTSSKLDKDSYLSRLRNLFIYLAGGVVFLTSVLGFSYIAIKVRDLQDKATNFEQEVVSQVNKLKIGVDSISQRCKKAEGKLKEIEEINDGLSGIVDGLNKGGEIEEYRTALKALYEQSSRL